jgi:flagellin
LASTQDNYATQAQRLATGLRIIKASDDGAGMAVSERLKNQVRGLNQAARNAQDGISLIQTAEGAMSEAHNILARMRELAVQAASDTINNTDRTNLNTEFTSLLAEIDRIANSTQFNGVAVLTGASTAMKLQIGANTDSGGDNVFTLNVTPSGSFYASVLSPTMSEMGVTTQSIANLAISSLGFAINKVSTARTENGSMQSRLESATRTLGVASENAAAANRRIADADIAQSMSELVPAQILEQAGISVLAQANQAPSLVLQLLK